MPDTFRSGFSGQPLSAGRHGNGKYRRFPDTMG